MSRFSIRFSEGIVTSVAATGVAAVIARSWPWVAPVAEAWWFQLSVAVLAAFVTGYWFRKLVAAWDAASPATQNEKLAAEISRVADLCHAASRGPLGSDRKAAGTAHAEASILMQKLIAAGLEFPHPSNRLTQQETLEAYSNVFGAIFPLVRHGAFDVARDTAATLSSCFPSYLGDDRQKQIRSR